MTILLGAYGSVLLAVGGLYILLVTALRKMVAEDLRTIGAVVNDLCLSLWFYPVHLRNAYRYRPRHGTYAPATRAWRMVL
jgi:hypothetical protein